jgi:phage terminase large subunit
MSILDIKTPRWGIDFLNPARYKAAWGGRCSGKSHFFAEMLVENHIMNCDFRSVCIREVQKSLNQSVKRLIEMKIEALGLGSYFEIQRDCIKNLKGSGMMIFQGMNNHNADSIKSLEGYDVAWGEEAQSLSQRSLDLLRPTIRKEGSELWFTFNPRFETDPIDMLLRGRDEPKNSIIREVNYQDNPWMPKIMIDEMEYDRGRDPDKYAHVWLGKYLTNSESRVFKNWRVDEFESPVDAVHRLGADFGFAADPTTLVRCHLIGRTIYFDYEAYMIGCEIVNTPELFLTVPESEKWPIVADCARPETISHLRKHGFPKIMSSVKGANSVHEGIEWMKSYDIVVHPRCRHIIDELTMYSYKKDPLTDKILPVLEDKNNHMIDAARYALEAVRRAPAKQPLKVNALPTMNRW